ncbi:MAG: rubrerythrin [Flexistipes sinusarabici]|uniref:Rubrerythrin n=1 Tax=Flexistipes sinusarabici TaxID=2352 RepID=A0A5D0MQJ7_FLESI|nr:ferritin family protein [Flexistipes sinusarabici]TYB33951.1 MAG: rubrerythrin [Flexistipes sinusarabici]
MDRKQKKKSLEEMIEVVLFRIPKEIEAMRFYKSAAEKATDDAAKELFEHLAAQEKGHEAELRRILNDLKNQLNELKKQE